MESTVHNNNEYKIMYPYSLRKIMTNKILENSVLNPETNSLSPSIKSNGARFISASTLIKSSRIRGNVIKVNISEDFNIIKIFIELSIIINGKISR